MDCSPNTRRLSARTQQMLLEHLDEYLEYRDGKFFYKKQLNRNKPGMEAGFLEADGRVRISIQYRLYYRSLLVWLLHKGVLPQKSLDHRNKIRDDDRIDNLREATMREQQLYRYRRQQ